MRRVTPKSYPARTQEIGRRRWTPVAQLEHAMDLADALNNAPNGVTLVIPFVESNDD